MPVHQPCARSAPADTAHITTSPRMTLKSSRRGRLNLDFLLAHAGGPFLSITNMKLDTLNYGSLMVLLDSLDHEVREAHDKLTRITQAPTDYPGIARFYMGVNQSLSAALRLLPAVIPTLEKLHASTMFIEKRLLEQLDKTSGLELESALASRKSNHEAYLALQEAATLANESRQAALGMALLLALADQQSLRKHHVACWRRELHEPTNDQLLKSALSEDFLEREDAPVCADTVLIHVPTFD